MRSSESLTSRFVIMSTRASTPQPVSSWILRNAYEHCLQLERSFSGTQESGTGVPSPLLSARVLGYLLREISSHIGRDAVANEILDCITDGALMQVARVYYNCFILACESLLSLLVFMVSNLTIAGFIPVKCGYSSTTTPAPPKHSSRDSFDHQRDSYRNTEEEARLDHRTAKKWINTLVLPPAIALTDLSPQASVRDRYQCPFTGLYKIQLSDDADQDNWYN